MRARAAFLSVLILSTGPIAWVGHLPGIVVSAWAAGAPLDIPELRLEDKANTLLRGTAMLPTHGDWGTLPSVPQKTVAAARALDEAGRTAFVQKAGAAFKALVMSDAFQKAHTAYIARQYKAVDHGLPSVPDPEALMQSGRMAEAQAAMQRQQIAALAQSFDDMAPEMIQMMLAQQSRDWVKRANEPARKDKAKYQKMAALAQSLQGLGPADSQKLRRGYTVLMSMETGGPDSEEAIAAAVDQARREDEQRAWNKYNLRTMLKLQLSTFVALVPTVDFAAATAPRKGVLVFTNAAYEKNGAGWKACYRAGKGPSEAAAAIARGWLAEL